MILGIGTDITYVTRFERLLARFGPRAARRILGGHELDDFARSRHPARFLARRFAAKEAFAKALGTGIRAPATLTAIRVAHDDLGRPLFAYGPELEALMRARRLRAHLSISDEADVAVAFAVIETESHDT